ncbi:MULTISPECIES: DUF3784 domain-containing protein [Clostridium]|uniref:DUF3784 domain-containing protein n=3 Tax=Clostridium TaxID=1485 RepID=D8GU96_CLOLD|nr:MULTISPECIES: DUF3784 domain-containing protein [Clostridium]ADK14759.1 conserved hypothetical protein [Clostridium ljungdahlii DSM 13528]AGY78007.1 DUF3784 domain-containing protein [Clostridium autoethanogenum DSM 10061]ALU38141.1 Hypothetical protein CLAU_3714 [Clostridium autoethanogenum DSM 10061]OAA85957.1 hypothetical protein WX45_00162 [Clostridium ljungdahlii DSM 13528]OVY50905.1 hypothetical protein WX72_02066 [Clostridium autoethanogenum]
MGGTIILLLVLMLFIILGVVFSLGKGAFLISGYNMLSKEEKAEYDEKALCKFMGKSMFAIAFSVFLWELSSLIKQHILFVIGLILLLGTVIFILVYSNTKNRFKKC